MTSDRYRVLVSHRARWDLELLPAAIATSCFDFLDAVAVDEPGLDVSTLGQPLVAGFAGLQVLQQDGFRLICRVDPRQLLITVVHVDAPGG
jgi:mRNA-degrading endonuclease RelE of RelBE toxin-antitoxin system